MRRKRIITKSVLFGAIVGAGILFFFGEGFGMAFYLAAEGAFLGSIGGGVVGVMLRIFR